MRVPAAPQTPPGVPGWYYEWLLARGFNPYHPEHVPAHVRAEYEGRALREARAWFRLIAADHKDDRPATRAANRDRAIKIVRDRLRVALQPFPPRNPYRTCPCHPIPLGLPRLEGDTIFDQRLAALRRRLESR